MGESVKNSKRRQEIVVVSHYYDAHGGGIERTVRQLIALAHPDRWPDTPLAHELTVALVALRTTLQPGATRVPSTGR